MKKTFFISLLGIFLIGCATPYKRATNPYSEGYYDTLLQEGVYDITFNANAETNIKQVKDYVLLRAAEVCLENNYKTFYIVSKDDNSTTDSTMISQTSYINNKSYTYYIPISETSPSASVVVQCSANDDLFFKAEDIKNNLRQKYKLK